MRHRCLNGTQESLYQNGWNWPYFYNNNEENSPKYIYIYIYIHMIWWSKHWDHRIYGTSPNIFQQNRDKIFLGDVFPHIIIDMRRDSPIFVVVIWKKGWGLILWWLSWKARVCVGCMLFLLGDWGTSVWRKWDQIGSHTLTAAIHCFFRSCQKTGSKIHYQNGWNWPYFKSLTKPGWSIYESSWSTTVHQTVLPFFRCGPRCHMWHKGFKGSTNVV